LELLFPELPMVLVDVVALNMSSLRLGQLIDTSASDGSYRSLLSAHGITPGSSVKIINDISLPCKPQISSLQVLP